MKKFSINNIADFDVLNNAIVGFEFEFYSDKSYYKLLEYLNRELEGIDVKGFNKYHSKFKPTENFFKIEPDYSLGSSGIELITGPLPYVNAKIILLRILKFIQEFGRTNDKCSIHINLSFDKNKTDKTLELTNILKLILDIDENYIYSKFPEREGNFYAKSVKKIIPFKGYDFSNEVITHLQNNLELPNTKYYGININTIPNGRLEFRYIGGHNYHHKTTEILELMDYFILTTYNSIKEPLSSDNVKELREYLNDNISNFKKFKKIEDFISEFPSIKLQINKSADINMLKVYYDTIYTKLFDIVNNIYNIQDCIINFDTENHRFEIIDASFKGIFDLKNIDLIQCTIDSVSLLKCSVINCDIKNSHFHNTNIINSNISNSKVESSKVDSSSYIKDCYLFNTFMDGTMDGGVFRSGKIGENAEISDETEIITYTDTYFGVKQQKDDKGKKQLDKEKWLEK